MEPVPPPQHRVYPVMRTLTCWAGQGSLHPESHWSQSYYDRRCQVLKSQEVCVLNSTEGSSWCPHGPGHRYKVFPYALPTLLDGSSQERDMLTPLAHGDAPLPLPPPPTTVQGCTLSGRSETSYNPLSLQQPPARLRPHLSTFHSA